MFSCLGDGTYRAGGTPAVVLDPAAKGVWGVPMAQESCVINVGRRCVNRRRRGGDHVVPVAFLAGGVYQNTNDSAFSVCKRGGPETEIRKVKVIEGERIRTLPSLRTIQSRGILAPTAYTHVSRARFGVVEVMGCEDGESRRGCNPRRSSMTIEDEVEHGPARRLQHNRRFQSRSRQPGSQNRTPLPHPWTPRILRRDPKTKVESKSRPYSKVPSFRGAAPNRAPPQVYVGSHCSKRWASHKAEG